MTDNNRLTTLENDLRTAMHNNVRRLQHAMVSQLRHTGLMDAIDEAIVITGTLNEIISINKRVATIFNLQHEKTIGNHIADFFEKIVGNSQMKQNDELQKFIAEIKGNAELLTNLSITTELTSPHQLFYKLYVGPIYDEKYGFIGRIWKFEDVTESTLLDKAKSDFIAIASHQLRTPVTTIMGYLEMLNNGDYGQLPDTMKEPFDAVKQSVKRMHLLVNDLLSTSRLETNKTPLKISQFNIVNTIEEQVALQAPQIKEKELTIQLLPQQKTILLNTDNELVGECIKNYLSNAVKYSPQHATVKIDVTIEANAVKVAVSDNGLGIPESAKSHIFEKMFRADNVLTGNFEGTGLGLYFVKQAITKMGGSVGFESNENNGSKFWFTLPLQSSK